MIQLRSPTHVHRERRSDMTFIRTILPSEAEGAVREMYQHAQSRVGYVPNWAQAFSLRPGCGMGGSLC
jgi:hypothetical protein